VADFFDVPEHAMLSFEKLTGLNVSIHDLHRSILPFLAPMRFNHTTAPCRAIKAIAGDACRDFDSTRMRDELKSLPDGVVKVCHAGLVEWIIAVNHDGRQEWIIFAGQRRPGPGLKKFVDNPLKIRPPGWEQRLQELKPVDDDEAEWILESFRQLAARLQRWRVEHDAMRSRQPKDAGAYDSRQSAVRAFIFARHTKPVSLADLAKFLHLSETRAGHAVREACGVSFIKLLIEARMRTAAGLLRHTNYSVIDVAQRSGFRDISNFHELFRKHFNATPHQYRRNCDGSGKARR
jgi:AraC-like DNA-binding protein